MIRQISPETERLLQALDSGAPRETVKLKNSSVWTATELEKPKAGDAISLSPLAAALSDEAMDLFIKLDAQDRTALGDLVSSGQMSGEEINLALMDRLNTARNGRYGEIMEEKGDRSPDRSLYNGPIPVSALGDPKYAIVGRFDTTNNVIHWTNNFRSRANGEQEAGAKLRETGFTSASFDATVQTVATKQIDALVAGQEATTKN